LTVETVVITACWWRECGDNCRWRPRPSTAPSRCHGEAGVRLQSFSSHPKPPPISWTITRRACAEGDGARTPFDHPV